LCEDFIGVGDGLLYVRMDERQLIWVDVRSSEEETERILEARLQGMAAKNVDHAPEDAG
jgi:hypothetical protein